MNNEAPLVDYPQCCTHGRSLEDDCLACEKDCSVEDTREAYQRLRDMEPVL